MAERITTFLSVPRDDLLRTGEPGDGNTVETAIGSERADTFESPQIDIDYHYNDFDEAEGDTFHWLFS